MCQPAEWCNDTAPRTALPRSPCAGRAVTASRGAPMGAWRNTGICRPRVVPVPVSLPLLSLLAWAQRGLNEALEVHAGCSCTPCPGAPNRRHSLHLHGATSAPS